MSIIFGVWATDGRRIDARELEGLARATERYAPDGTWLETAGQVGMGYQPYHTHARSRLDTEPAQDERGSMLSFDGRLDNHEELRSLLGLEGECSDSKILLAAFKRWGQDCFRRLVGDWALALWSSTDQAVYLARDHAGSRTLYYELKKDRILWATHLETFFAAEPSRSVDASYLACYLAAIPSHDRTPFAGIRAVAPAHVLRFGREGRHQRPHWNWAGQEPIRYRREAEYAEHFLTLFEQAVERRTGPGAPILAHLSGGMDSTSIVCVSDKKRRRQGARAADLLDTISYFDDSEPNWDERPYFEAIERNRGRRGIHLPLPLLSAEIEEAPVRYLWPGADRATYENERRLLKAAELKDYRVLLSGFGGDELLGGVPNPLPELADLLAEGDLAAYFKSAIGWCLVDHTPLLKMTGRALRFLIGQYLPARLDSNAIPPWGTAEMKRLLEGAWAEQARKRVTLGRPSAIDNIRMAPALLETLPHRCPAHCVRLEWRYPYLDRDLVDFLLRVPRSVLVQPGRRRALMRSALEGIVPAEVLERRRKGMRSRSIPLILRSGEQRLTRLFEEIPAPLADLVDPAILRREALEVVRRSDLTRMQFVVRALMVLLWAKMAFPAEVEDRHLLPAQSSVSGSLSSKPALSAELLVLTGRNPNMENRT